MAGIRAVPDIDTRISACILGCHVAAVEQTHAWSMTTLGVDLAAQPGDTGVAMIEWNESGAEVTHLAEGLAGGGADSSGAPSCSFANTPTSVSGPWP